MSERIMTWDEVVPVNPPPSLSDRLREAEAKLAELEVALGVRTAECAKLRARIQRAMSACLGLK